MASAPIFIVGPPRTGTTLTARILTRHSAIHISPVELFFFQRLYERRRSLGEPDGSEATTQDLMQALRQIAYKKRRDQAYWHSLDKIFADPAFFGALRHARSYGEVLACFMEAQAHSVGKQRWGNQVPADLFALDHIFEFYGAPRIVVCVRHPLDYLLSCRDRAERAARKNKPTKARLNSAQYHPVITSLQWRLCIRQAHKAQALWGENIFINRYEDLVQDSEAQVSRLCAFLDVPFEPEMLQVEQNNSSRAIDAKGIFTTSVGQGRIRLSAEEIYTCEALCRKPMALLGYDRLATEARRLSLCRDLLASPAAMLRALRAGRAFGGDPAPYALKRLFL